MPSQFKPLEAPKKITDIYETHPIFSESIYLDTEQKKHVKTNEGDLVRVRALDGFVFIKNGTFVYPRYQDSTPEWWKGVVGYGYIAALTGDFRWFIWAGQWDEDYDGKHMEVVMLTNVQGMAKESHPHWREGEEEILWVETKAGYSYALLEPAEEYGIQQWGAVVNSWARLPPGESQADPSFIPIPREDNRPSWWKGKYAGAAWKFFMKPIRDEQRRAQIAKEQRLVKERREKVERGKKLAKALTRKVAPKAKGRANAKGKNVGSVKAVSKGKGKGKKVVSEDEDEDEDADADADEDGDEAEVEEAGEEVDKDVDEEEDEHDRAGNKGAGKKSGSTKRKRVPESESSIKLRPRLSQRSYAELSSEPPESEEEGKGAGADDRPGKKGESSKVPPPKRLRQDRSPKKMEVVITVSPKDAAPKKKKAEPVTNPLLSDKDQSQSGMDLVVDNPSEDGSRDAVGDENGEDKPGASQPTQALRTLVLDNIADEPMDEVASGNVEGRSHGTNPDQPTTDAPTSELPHYPPAGYSPNSSTPPIFPDPGFFSALGGITPSQLLAPEDSAAGSLSVAGAIPNAPPTALAVIVPAPPAPTPDPTPSMKPTPVSAPVTDSSSTSALGPPLLPPAPALVLPAPTASVQSPTLAAASERSTDHLTAPAAPVAPATPATPAAPAALATLATPNTAVITPDDARGPPTVQPAGDFDLDNMSSAGYSQMLGR